MHVKICGLTRTEEVNYLFDNRADFAGIVCFYEKSKRNVSINTAKEIINKIHALNRETSHKINSVAVTVKPEPGQINLIKEAGFDFIQIHGKVNDEIIDSCPLPVLKAFNVDDLDDYEHYLNMSNIKGFVFDAGVPGSGKIFDWNVLNNLKRDKDRLFILAGGLNEKNVREAIQFVSPDCVDVSSGVEYDEAVLTKKNIITGKDPDKVKSFIENALNI